jgi:hypothetical protein
MVQIRSNSNLAMVVISIGFTLFGGGLLLFWGIPNYSRAKASTEWPAVEGEVVASQVEKSSSFKNNKTRTTYFAVVQFSYDIDGQHYESDAIWPGGGYQSTSLAPHQAVVDRYPPGKKMPVYYDPAIPHRGVLEPGVHFTEYMLLGISGGFLACGIGMGLVLSFCTVRSIGRSAGTV